MEGFAFDDEELEALQAFEKLKLRSTDANNSIKAVAASGEAGASGSNKGGTENNTKSKEQND